MPLPEIPDNASALGSGQRQRIILLPCAAVCSTGRSRRPKGDGWRRGDRTGPPEVMQYRIAMERGFLRAELLERETAEETRRFFRAVVFESVRHGCSRVLGHVRSSKTLFTVERFGVLETFKKLASDPAHRIALLGDTVELGMSHDYVVLLARQQGITLRNFKNESEAVAWVTDRR